MTVRRRDQFLLGLLQACASPSYLLVPIVWSHTQQNVSCTVKMTTDENLETKTITAAGGATTRFARIDVCEAKGKSHATQLAHYY